MMTCLSPSPSIIKSAREFLEASIGDRYSYYLSWLGRPIIQYPQDIVAFQELVFNVLPDLIVETGIAHGGSLVLSASLLARLDVMDGRGPRHSKRKVVGIDIDICPHNRQALDQHPLRFKMELIQDSSIQPSIFDQLRGHAKTAARFLLLWIPTILTITFSLNSMPMLISHQ